MKYEAINEKDTFELEALSETLKFAVVSKAFGIKQSVKVFDDDATKAIRFQNTQNRKFKRNNIDGEATLYSLFAKSNTK